MLCDYHLLELLRWKQIFLVSEKLKTTSKKQENELIHLVLVLGWKLKFISCCYFASPFATDCKHDFFSSALCLVCFSTNLDSDPTHRICYTTYTQLREEATGTARERVRIRDFIKQETFIFDNEKKLKKFFALASKKCWFAKRNGERVATRESLEETKDFFPKWSLVKNSTEKLDTRWNLMLENGVDIVIVCMIEQKLRKSFISQLFAFSWLSSDQFVVCGVTSLKPKMWHLNSKSQRFSFLGEFKYHHRE